MAEYVKVFSGVGVGVRTSRSDQCGEGCLANGSTRVPRSSTKIECPCILVHQQGPMQLVQLVFDSDMF